MKSAASRSTPRVEDLQQQLAEQQAKSESLTARHAAEQARWAAKTAALEARNRALYVIGHSGTSFRWRRYLSTVTPID